MLKSKIGSLVPISEHKTLFRRAKYFEKCSLSLSMSILCTIVLDKIRNKGYLKNIFKFLNMQFTSEQSDLHVLFLFLNFELKWKDLRF
jgi:hypothetical protein